MHKYVVRRLLLFIPALLGASMLIFVLMRMVPGDIAEILVYQAGTESGAIQQKQIEQIRRERGLDRPVVVQYLAWLGNALRGDFGYSYTQRRPVTDILKERFPRSMELAFLTLVVAILWAIPLGVISAVRQKDLEHPSGAPRTRYTKTEATRLIEHADQIVRFCADLLARLR